MLCGETREIMADEELGFSSTSLLLWNHGNNENVRIPSLPYLGLGNGYPLSINKHIFTQTYSTIQSLVYKLSTFNPKKKNLQTHYS